MAASPRSFSPSIPSIPSISAVPGHSHPPDPDSLSTLRSRLTPLSLNRAPALPETLAQTGEYSIFGLNRAADQSGLRGRQVGFTLILFGVATGIALLYS